MKLTVSSQSELRHLGKIESAAFHQQKPILYFLFQNHLQAYDFTTQTMVQKSQLQNGQATHIFTSFLPFVLIYHQETGALSVFETNQNILVKLFNLNQLTNTKLGPIVGCVSNNMFLFASYMQKTVYVLNVMDRTGVKSLLHQFAIAENKKPITCIYVFGEIVCVGFADGKLTMYNQLGETICDVDDLYDRDKDSELRRITSISGSTSRGLLGATTAGGEFMFWELQTMNVSLTEKDIFMSNPIRAHYIFDKGSKDKVKITDLFFHDRLPVLFLVDNLGQQHAYRFDAQIRFLIAMDMERTEINVAGVNLKCVKHPKENMLFYFEQKEEVKEVTQVVGDSAKEKERAEKERKEKERDKDKGAASQSVKIEESVVVAYEPMMEFDESNPALAFSPHTTLTLYSYFYSGNIKFLTLPYVPRQKEPFFYSTPMRLPGAEGDVHFKFNSECYFITNGNLNAITLCLNTHSLAKLLPKQAAEGDPIEPYRLLYCQKMNGFLVFYDRVNQYGVISQVFTLVSPQTSSFKEATTFAGKDGVFLPGPPSLQAADNVKDVPNGDSAPLNPVQNARAFILSMDGLELILYDIVQQRLMPKPIVFALPTPVASIWETPLRQGRIILLFDQLHSRLLLSDEAAADYTVPTQSPMSTNSKQGRNDFLLNTDIQYLLKTSTEYIVQVAWTKASVDDGYVLAVITNSYLYLLDQNFQEIIVVSISSCTSSRTSGSEQSSHGINSCFWVGFSLFFTTKTHLKYITLRGHIHTLFSLDLPGCVIMDVLCDRVVLACSHGHLVDVYLHSVHLLEPLLMGFLHNSYLSQDVRERELRSITRLYESTHFSLSLIKELDCSDYTVVALLLLQNNQLLQRAHPWLRFQLALRSLNFNVAYQILLSNINVVFQNQSFSHLVNYQLQSEEVHRYALYLAEICIHYAQFKTAHSIAKLIGNELLLLQIASLTDSKKLFKNIIQSDLPSNFVKKLAKKKLQGDLPVDANGKSPTTLDVIAEGELAADAGEEPQSESFSMESEEEQDWQDAVLINWPITYLSEISLVKNTNWFATKRSILVMLTYSHYFTGEKVNDWAIIPFLNMNESINSWSLLKCPHYILPTQAVETVTQTTLSNDGSRSNVVETKRVRQIVDLSSQISSSTTEIDANDLYNLLSDEKEFSQYGRNTSENAALKGSGAPSGWKNTSPIESLNFMNAALMNIENNELKLAQKNLELCLEDLSAVHYDSAHPKDVAINLKPLRFCVMYYYFVNLLEHSLHTKMTSKSFDNINMSAYFLTLAARLKLHPRHKVVAMLMAINANLAIKNYGYAMEFLRIILEKSSNGALEANLELCESHKGHNEKPIPSDICSYVTLKALNSTYMCCDTCTGMFEQQAEIICPLCTNPTLKEIRK